MHTLYLAEKSSQAMDIAKVIGIKGRGDGFIELATGDTITWARGHMLELADPAAHNEAWGGRWAWSQLPMIPAQWKYVVNKSTAGQYKIISRLVKEAKRVIIATDAGREGELIAREILEHCKFKGVIERFWTSSLVPADIKVALGKLKPGSATYPLYEAALARQHCDNMYGLSGTRGATLAANVRGDYFAMGRVQTPTLAMVVRRCLDVRNFDVQAYYELEAKVSTAEGKVFKMWHAPEEKDRITTMDEAVRRKAIAEGAKSRLKVERSSGREGAPLPYSLPVLQKDANRILGLSVKKTLEIAQKLYEVKATTYPRTDCQYLAASQMDEVNGVLDVVARRFGSGVAELKKYGIVKRTTTFDDSKLTDHHGIIPTAQFVELEGAELQLYTLICQRYLQLLGPDCKFDSTRVTLDANGIPFKANGKVITSPGWQALKLT